MSKARLVITAVVTVGGFRLVHDGEIAFDVPPILSAQVWVFANGNGRKTDAGRGGCLMRPAPRRRTRQTNRTAEGIPALRRRCAR